MNSAAARFAARYGLADLPHMPLQDNDCPTCPTEDNGSGAPLSGPRMANSCGFFAKCPTVFEQTATVNRPDDDMGRRSEPAYDLDDGQPDLAAAVWVQQSLSQDILCAGLKAASQLWPDPWASGVARLQHMAPLGRFSYAQWTSVRLGCATLLHGWDAEMRRLGWSVEDGFGVDPKMPDTAVHCYGLGILLGSGRVIEITDKFARIETRTGVRQTFTRKPNGVAVPIWTVAATPTAAV